MWLLCTYIKQRNTEKRHTSRNERVDYNIRISQDSRSRNPQAEAAPTPLDFPQPGPMAACSLARIPDLAAWAWSQSSMMPKQSMSSLGSLPSAPARPPTRGTSRSGCPYLASAEHTDAFASWMLVLPRLVQLLELMLLLLLRHWHSQEAGPPVPSSAAALGA